MARFLGTTFIVLFAVFSIYIVAVSAKKKKCQNSTDCGEWECCVVRYKTATLGVCKSLRGENDHCNPDEKFVRSRTYVGICPMCESGLECKPEKTINTVVGPINFNLRCVAKNTTSVQ